MDYDDQLKELESIVQAVIKGSRPEDVPRRVAATAQAYGYLKTDLNQLAKSTTYETEQPLVIDPQDCGCTDCLVRDSYPINMLDEQQIIEILEGAPVTNRTSQDLRFKIATTFDSQTRDRVKCGDLSWYFSEGTLEETVEVFGNHLTTYIPER